MNIDYSVAQWLLVGVLLILQNITFTMVSRARNSASLTRHILWGIGSNGVWFLVQAQVFAHFMKVAYGQLGTEMQITFMVYYVLMTVVGAVAAHWWALRSESGKSAVGASLLYRQVLNTEWYAVTLRLKHIESILSRRRDSAGRYVKKYQQSGTEFGD